MSDVPDDPNDRASGEGEGEGQENRENIRESIPLLLARTTSKIPIEGRKSRTTASLHPPPPRLTLAFQSTRKETAGTIGYLRSRLGAAGTIVAMFLV
ncbi:MAG: hypothetical protein JWO86_5813, partial [Myxococcaceae bacterium]|nr:hypothetical protein [Myxococcaceae bacterium]